MARSPTIASALTIAVAACGRGAGPSERAGDRAAAALLTGLDRAATVTAPWRCAALTPPPAPLPERTVGARRWTSAPLGLATDAPVARVAVVADARGAAAAELRAALAAAEVELVVTVGGMGTTEAELTTSLGAVVDPRWLTVAVPGEAEAWPAHRAAIAALAGAGAAIVDGADARILDLGPTVVATLPGAGHRARLAAGDDGCGHDSDEVAAIVTAAGATAGDRPVVLMSPRAPQGGVGDRGVGGVHAGDPALAGAVAALALVVHAPIDGAPVAADVDRGPGLDSIAAGSLDPLPRLRADGAVVPRSATLIVADRRELRWQPVRLP